MLKDLNPAARSLAEYMEELSELAYSASWMHGLEFALWRSIVEGPKRYGRLDIAPAHIARLRSLSDACGGWTMFENAGEETFVGTNAWQKIYAERIDTIKRWTK